MKKIYFLAALTLLLAGCNPSDDNSGSSSGNDFTKNFGASASRDFIGQVVDVNNQPIQSATVSIGTSVMLTDANGVFMINGAEVHEKFAYITAKKAGYVDGSRTLVPTEGKNNVKIMMIASSPTAIISSGSSSEVALPSGTKVIFDGAFQTETGTAYTGNVAVSMFHLTPSNQDIGALMPGMLYAQSADGGAKVLQTFGMMNVELRGSSGEKLQIAQGHNAQIKMQIDASQMATAPATIPLWHFDETKGYWIEEGSATKIGNQYVGNVSHFSWWNCDTFSSIVNLTVTVLDNLEHPLGNVGVGLTTSTNFNSYILHPDDNGVVSGQIPANEPLTLKIYDPCGNIIHTSQIGPFITNTELSPIYLHLGSIHTNTVTGTFKQCNGANVTNGYVEFHYKNNVQVSFLENGNFSFNALVCNDSDTFELLGYDLSNSQSTSRVTYNFTGESTDIGQLMACNTIGEFVSYAFPEDVFGNELSVFETEHITTQSMVGQFSNEINANIELSIETNAGVGMANRLVIVCGSTELRNYTPTDSYMRITKVTPTHLQYYFPDQFLRNYQLRVNKFGPVGDYIDVTYSADVGYYQNNLWIQEDHISGVAHVIRDN